MSNFFRAWEVFSYTNAASYW